jgi:hypothetical protein
MIFLILPNYELVEMARTWMLRFFKKLQSKKVTPINKWWQRTQLEFVNVIMVCYYCNGGASGWKMQICTPWQASIKRDPTTNM